MGDVPGVFLYVPSAAGIVIASVQRLHRGLRHLWISCYHHAMAEILVVCTANMCRSPMAEGLLRARLADAGLGDRVRVRSAGVRAPAGFGATDHGVTLLAARGIDISRHQARPLTDALLREADLILVMEEAHRSAIARQAPQHLAKVRLFTELAGGRDDVADPVGGTLDDYRRTLAGMDAVLDQGWTTLLAALPPVDTPPPDVRPPE